MKRTASANGTSKSKSRSARWPRFVLCLENAGNEASLEVGKVYRQIRPHKSDMPRWIRVIDESGEDYLFPARRFVPVDLPAKAKRVFAASVG
jgi:hypothetical protein